MLGGEPAGHLSGGRVVHHHEGLHVGPRVEGREELRAVELVGRVRVRELLAELTRGIWAEPQHNGHGARVRQLCRTPDHDDVAVRDRRRFGADRRAGGDGGVCREGGGEEGDEEHGEVSKSTGFLKDFTRIFSRVGGLTVAENCEKVKEKVEFRQITY